jgi:dihydroorotate dehydrogenase electron transfer subunit
MGGQLVKLFDFEILANDHIARDTYSVTLLGDCSAITAPGQFVNVALDGLYLRRPFSVCSLSGDVLMFVYKIVGQGTEKLSKLKPGVKTNILTGLGNGFGIDENIKNPLLIGGGVGAAPLYYLAKELQNTGANVTAILGFKSSDEIFLAGELAQAGAKVFVSTEDGSAGVSGFVTDAINQFGAVVCDYVYACGPEAMLRAVYDITDTPGQYSFESRMGCGFGACLSCTCETKYELKRICKDGPVLKREEINW